MTYDIKLERKNTKDTMSLLQNTLIMKSRDTDLEGVLHRLPQTRLVLAIKENDSCLMENTLLPVS